MSDSRERMMAAIEFRRPDRIPLFYHASEAGLHVHGRKLLELFNRVPGDNGARFDALPSPPPATLAADGSYHELRRDAWGTVWEYLIFGIQGHPKEYPLRDWSEARGFEFPPPEVPDRSCYERAKREKFPTFGSGGSLFERPSGLRPFDEVMMDVFEENPELLAFLDRLVDYYGGIIRRELDDGCEIIMFGDDYGTQTNAIFPPELFDRVFGARYRKLFAPIREAKRKILFHSCGKIDRLLPNFFELGIDLFWPQLSLYGRDEAFLDACAAHHVALLLHPDRQYLIPRGTPAEIRAWVRDMADRYRAGGGVFYVEIEDDAPWENVQTLVESIAEYR